MKRLWSRWGRKSPRHPMLDEVCTCSHQQALHLVELPHACGACSCTGFKRLPKVTVDQTFPPDSAEGRVAAGKGTLLDYAIVVRKLGEDLLQARDLFERYGDHQSWRCAWPERWPWTPDCPCGLVENLRAIGVEADTRVPEDVA